jgi:hypothetical protein
MKIGKSEELMNKTGAPELSAVVAAPPAATAITPIVLATDLSNIILD